MLRITEARYGVVPIREVLQVQGAVKEGEFLVINGIKWRGREVEGEDAFWEAIVGVIHPQLLCGIVYSFDAELSS